MARAPSIWLENPMGTSSGFRLRDHCDQRSEPSFSTVEKDGSLRWSQWSLKRKPLDVPIGFSSQMDGALAIEPFVDANGTLLTLKPTAQTLYQRRYPFIV